MGTLYASSIAFSAEIPSLSPVKLPGPIVMAEKSKSPAVIPAFCKISSMAGTRISD